MALPAMALDPSDHQAVRAAARDILSEHQFDGRQRNWWQNVLYYVAHPDQVLARLIDFVSSLFSGGGTGVVFAWIFVVVMVALVIVGVVFLTRSTSHDTVIPVMMAPDVRAQTAAEYREMARECEQRAEWRAAIRFCYAGLLADLGERGILRLRSGRTTGEYVSDVVSALPDGGDAFVGASRVFEVAWYGNQTPSENDLQVMRSFCDAVLTKAAV